MTGPTRRARAGTTLGTTLGFGEKLFSSSEERRFVSAIESGLESVEAALVDEMSFADDLADVTSRYLLDAGGKRIRPTLALVTAQLGNGNNDPVIQAAAAIEITHLASLYHDDVMDEAEMRRGVPSAQIQWNNSIAILTGDLLFARASKLVAGLGETIIRLQADTFERLCLGQLHETMGPRDDEDAIEHYIQVLADKTGSLIAAAAQTGVLLAGAPVEYRDAVTAFGEKIGIAFQLVDDIIDLAPPVGETGKTPGTDLRSGVSTLPLLYLRRLATTDPEAADLLTRIERDVNVAHYAEADDEELTAAIAELRAHDVTRQTLAEAQRWSREAVADLAPLPEGPVKKALVRFADSIVERSR
ncbi:polyprenyl synthetase family protein [Marisediminicola senii]|uniref:polyprenyl synthetase family protein n=1 Tax=Marisediminicola senii TaxID=2711233 RepID=UPI0013ED4646|nr:polyprenyl synthetase family protein [Marisediminicola senii]